jgi:hypothetical protein
MHGQVYALALLVIAHPCRDPLGPVGAPCSLDAAAVAAVQTSRNAIKWAEGRLSTGMGKVTKEQKGVSQHPMWLAEEAIVVSALCGVR